MIISKKKYDDLHNEIAFHLMEERRISNKNIQINNLNEQYKNIIQIKAKKILELSEKYKIANAKIGGLSRGNNKLKKDKENLQNKRGELSATISQMKKELEQLKKQNEMLTSSNNKFMVENEKMRGIVDNFNKLVSRKMKSTPTSEQIINYDRKHPSR